jgi:hypothetical protein
MGLDIGKKNDYTAISIVEAALGYRGFELEGGGRYEFKDILYPPDEVVFTVVWLERLPLRMSYPDMVKICASRFQAINTTGKGAARNQGQVDKLLAVDATGVGTPVVDLLKKAGLNPISINITGGVDVTHSGDDYRVPKRDLVTSVQVLQQARRLKVAPGLVEGQTLAREMENFSYKISDAGHDSYGAWREGTHDDLTLSVACALWTAQHVSGSRGFYLFGPGDDVYDLLVNFTGI